MDLKSLPLFSALQQKMSWLNRRQTLLSENIANANTPGYRPRDLKKPDFDNLLNRYSDHGIKLKTTQKGHLTGAAASHVMAASSGVSISNSDGGSYNEIKIKPDEIEPNGNGVTLEAEMVKMGESQIEYTTLVNVYRKHVGMINAVLGKGR